MSRPLFFRAEADSDLEEIRAYLLEESPEAKRKFDRNFENLVESLILMPYLYAKRWRAVRAVKVPGFKYVIYFIVGKHYIDVIAIMHGSREASAWKSRL